MKRLLIFALLLTLAVLATTGCDLLSSLPFPLPFLTEATTADTTTAADVTTTAAETTTAPVTTAAAPVTTTGPWLIKQDMSEYITLPTEAYQGHSFTLASVPEITMQDVERYLFNKRVTTTLNPADGPIQYGDTVKLYYHGEVNMGTTEAPEWVEFIGGSNFGDKLHSLVIGSNSFIPGFEDALIGLDPADCGSVEDADGTVVYISYSYSYTDENNTTRVGSRVDRVDLAKNAAGEYIAPSRYSVALRDALSLLGAGEYVAVDGVNAEFVESFDLNGDFAAEELTLSAIKVTSRVTERLLEIKVGFPSDYGEPLSGRDARWIIMIESLERPELSALDYTLVSQTIGITYETVKGYGLLSADEIAAIGEDTEKQEAAVMAHFEACILLAMEESRRDSIKEMLWDAFSEYIVDAVTVKAYPEASKTAYMEMFRAEAEATYQQYSYYFASFAEFLMAYYGTEYFPDAESIDVGFAAMAELQLRYEMAIYHIADAEGLMMDEAEADAYIEKTIEELLDYYNAYYEQYGMTITEEDLIEAGITPEAILEDACISAVRGYITEALYDLIVFE